MKWRQIGFWLLLGAGLLAFIFIFQRHRPAPAAGSERILPELDAAAVTSIQVRPSGPISLGIRAQRTNDTWQLAEPFSFPARGTNIEALLHTLVELRAATYLAPSEIKGRVQPEEEFGFASPQASIIVFQRGYRAHLIVGSLTAPGEEVFLKVVGREGVYVVDSAWLKQLPRSANDWRDTTLIKIDVPAVERLAVTNNARAFVLQRGTNRLWRMVWPLNSARADSLRIDEALEKLAQVQIQQFVSDDPRPDLERFGLAHPELELALGSGPNPDVLQFGKSAATATNQLYARRLGHDSIFTIAPEALAPWRGASVNDFRDPHLLTLTEPVSQLDVISPEPFSVARQTNGSWVVLPDKTPVDDALMKELLGALAAIQIVQFTKDVVNPPELPEFGLASPALQYVLKTSGHDQPLGSTNHLLVRLDFGLATNAPDRVFVRRGDETSVYAIGTNDFARLPTAGWQLRERRLWHVTVEDVAGVRIQQAGKKRELIHVGRHKWSFAPGSQGIINDLAVEETVRGLAETSVVHWVARGDGERARCGLGENSHRVTLTLKTGEELTVEFGRQAPSENQFAGVTFNGTLWIFEFPWALYRDVASYLSIP